MADFSNSIMNFDAAYLEISEGSQILVIWSKIVPKASFRYNKKTKNFSRDEVVTWSEFIMRTVDTKCIYS